MYRSVDLTENNNFHSQVVTFHYTPYTLSVFAFLMIQAKELKCPDKYNNSALTCNIYNNVFYTTLPFYIKVSDTLFSVSPIKRS